MKLRVPVLPLASIINSSVSPALTPMRIASLITETMPALMKLLTSFIAAPLPSAPQCVIVSAMQASTGRTASKVATSPPISSARLPVIACATLRVTGASIIRTPRAAKRSPTRRVVAGSIVLMST